MDKIVGLRGGFVKMEAAEVVSPNSGVRRAVLETMRQPLEEGRVTISRAAGTMTFPSEFMLVAAMNPTPDGKMPGESRSSPRKTSGTIVLSGLTITSRMLLNGCCDGGMLIFHAWKTPLGVGGGQSVWIAAQEKSGR